MNKENPLISIQNMNPMMHNLIDQIEFMNSFQSLLLISRISQFKDL